VAANLPAGTSVTITVTCPTDYNDGAVKVALAGTSPSFFATGLNLVVASSQTARWTSGVAVGSSSTAMYGGNVPGKFSVTLTFNTGAFASLVGGFSPGPLVVSPTPVTGRPVIKDPLRTLPAVPTSLLPVRASSAYILNNQSAVMYPGVYNGGIQLKNTSQAYLYPGIYVVDGGVDIGAQASFFSVPSTVTSTSLATWDTDCLQSNCGVLIYIKNATSNGKSFSMGAGSNVLLRPYNDQADYLQSTKVRAFRNLLMWQDKTPVPTSNSIQPALTLNGGGTLSMRGTLYAPSAMVVMTGGSGGSGGNSLDLTVQFITWDMQIQGNSHFNFYYRSQDFAQPIQYGLVE
jgi:hypothetical protein